MDEYVSKLQSEELDSLFSALLELKDVSECYRFFEDLCTVAEMTSIAQRWEVARMLDQGVTYQQIAHDLNVSTATISRVNRCLAYGAGGYRLILDRLRKGNG